MKMRSSAIRKTLKHRFPLVLASIYLLLGGTWIVVTDWLVLRLASVPEAYGRWQTYKGWGYVLATAGLLYFVVRGYVNRQVQTEQALRASEERLRITLNSIGDAVIGTDPMGRVVGMNPAAEALTGWAEAQARGKPLTEVFVIVNAQTGESAPNPVQRVLESGQIVGLGNHTQLIAKNGAEYQIADSAAPIRGADGQTHGVVLVFRDVTEDYRAREALQASEKRYKSLFNSIRDAILVADTSREIIDCNPAFSELFGYSLEEIRGQKTHAVYAEREQFEAMSKALREHTGDPNFLYVIDYRKKSGQVFPGETNVFYLEDQAGDTTGFIGLIRDISKRMQAESQLKAEKEWSERLINYAPNIVVGLQERSKIAVFNRFAEQLTGYKAEEVIGKEWIGTFIPEELRETIYQAWDDIVDNQLFDHHFENEIITKSGERRLIEWSNTILTENGEFLMILSLGADITVRKQAEDNLRESEAQYRLLFENNPFPMWIYDLETLHILAVNETAVLKYGYSEAEFLAMTLKDFRPPEDVPALLENVATATEVFQDSGPWRHQTKQGEIILVEIVSHSLEYSERPARLVIANDITARKQAENELRQLKDNLQAEVAQKTDELQERIAMLERFHDATIARELRMKELRDEIARLKGEAG